MISRNDPTTRLFTLVQRLLRKTKELAANIMIKVMRSVDSVLTITLDNSGELADHVCVAKATGADVYFAARDK